MSRWTWRGRNRRKGQTFAAPSPGWSVGAYVDAQIDGTSVTRESAMEVPAVYRGRTMVCDIATLPLRLLDPSRTPVRDPLFDQIDPQVPNVVTLAMTLEDLLFDAIGWWKVTTRGWNDYPVSCQHVDSRRVSLQPPADYQNPLPSGVDPRSVVWVDGKPVPARDMIRFDSPNPGLLSAGRRAIRRAIITERTAEMYALDPRPQDYFTPSDHAVAPDEDEVKAHMNAWVESRRKRATAFVPETLTYNTVQAPTPADMQLIQIQQRAALDIANLIGIDPEDLGISTTSRTYQNATDRRQDRVNDVLAPYMRAITDRLSMGDVTRRGYRAEFDLNDYMRADPATRWATYETAITNGVMDVAEVREHEDLPERITPSAPEPANALNPAQQNHKEGRMPTTFSAPEATTFRFETEATTFAADEAKRTITGTALIYGVPATNGEGTFTFAPGSLEWKRSAVSRVKLLRDHDWGALLGSATAVKDEGEHVTTSFKVARGPLGDQALAEAADGALDGLSVGIDITEYEETADGGYLVTKAHLHEVSLTPRPAFDDARLTSVAASNTKGTPMPDKAPDTAPADLGQRLADIEATLSKINTNAPDKGVNVSLAPAADERPEVVNPHREGVAFVREPGPYRFDRAGRFVKSEHDFSTDLGVMLRERDADGTRTEAGKRVMAQINQNFAVVSGNVDSLNPDINRPDMYYDPPANRAPLWAMVNKGAPPNGVQPFTVPKFASASGLVADHTEGTEPASGALTTTVQTVQPTALSGKVSVSREVIDMGGNPATSNIIWQRMVRAYEEGLEAATATFLNTLTAAADITITAGGATAPAEIQAAIVALNFAPGYDWGAFAVEQNLYTLLANAEDGDGRPLYPIIGASNANGTASNLFQRLNVAGVVATPAAALPAVVGSPNNSWLFDPSVVMGYATGPQRLEFPGTDSSGGYAPVAMVDVAIWGYKAFANLDIAGVRQVIYDTTA